MNVDWGFFQALEPPFFPFLLSIMFRAFGLYDYVAVGLSELMALSLCILVFWWTQREYGVPTAILSTVVVASIPMFIYYAKMALTDMTFTFFFSATVLAYFEALRSRRSVVFLVAGLLLVATMGVKYNGFQPLLVILIFIPFYLSIFRPKSSLNKDDSCLRRLFGFLPKLFLSVVPAFVLSFLFIAYLGGAFATYAGGITSLSENFLSEFNIGSSYLVRAIFANKAGELHPELFVTSGFYGEVIAEYVGLPVLVLGVIGAARGILERRVSTILLIIWISFVFVFFSSLPGTWPRVILPLIPPLTILAGQGAVSCVEKIARLLPDRTLRFNRKVRLDVSLKACFVIVLILVNLYSSIPAITNAHSAYREAADFIAANVPNRDYVFYVGQPDLLFYLHSLYTAGKYAIIVSDIGSMNASYAVVLDFLANLSPYYAQIQAHVSQMMLVAKFSDGAPTINMLDSLSFSRLRQLESDPDIMSIRIYFPSTLRSSSFQSNSPAMIFTMQGQVHASFRDFQNSVLLLASMTLCQTYSFTHRNLERILNEKNPRTTLSLNLRITELELVTSSSSTS
jgi:hypothetical protein